jgi:hypothetical protein
MRLHAYLFVQNLTQMNKYNKAGDDNAGREKILGSMGIKMALSLGEEADRKWFTALCGKRTLRTRGDSEQRGDNRSSSGYSLNETADDLIHEWEWTNMSPDRDGAIVVKAAEIGAGGREGVFKMPLVDASQTPAKTFFGLGTEEQEQAKREGYQRRLGSRASAADPNVPVWSPSFTQAMSQESRQEAIEQDEFSAWDEGIEQ